MSWFSKLIGSGISEPIDAIGNALDKVITSDEERMQAEAVLQKLRQQPNILQAEISKLQAQHRSAFVAGARPAIMWVCAIGLAFPFVINPVLQWYTGDPGPELPTESLVNLVLALTGLGALRTTEKLVGKSK